MPTLATQSHSQLSKPLFKLSVSGIGTIPPRWLCSVAGSLLPRHFARIVQTICPVFLCVVVAMLLLSAIVMSIQLFSSSSTFNDSI